MTRALAVAVAAAAASMLTTTNSARAADYHVGPGQTLTSIGAVPWATLQPGDHVFIHWRTTPYAEKWVLCRSGTADQPITISGVPGQGNALPIIDGSGAITPTNLNYTGEQRGLFKIGSANVPDDTLPSYIVVENLDLRGARSSNSFTGHAGDTLTYAANAAAFYVEKAAHLTIRNCAIHDSGNGLFIGVFDGQTEDILVEGNHIYDNGNVGSIFEHNSYTAALGITFQYNWYGPLCAGCDGNNLKDRSAGLVVRYNWIESGNRQLDLVDGEDSPAVPADSRYHQTFVYGNVLIEPAGAGNSQIAHYGGDSGTEADYRKGTLYFYNNTVVSTRSGNTTLLRLSTAEEHADMRNNIVLATAGSGYLAMLGTDGVLDLSHNWLQQGWVDSHEAPVDFLGTVTDDGSNITGSAPGFLNAGAQDFALAGGSLCINAGTTLASAVLPGNAVIREYRKHQQNETRPLVDAIDLGAFEYCGNGSCSRPDAGALDAAQPDTSTATDAGAHDSASVPDVTPTDTAVRDAAAQPDAVASDSAATDRAALADHAATPDHPAQDSMAFDTAARDAAALDHGGIAIDAASDGAAIGFDHQTTQELVADGCACHAVQHGRTSGAVVALLALGVLSRRRRTPQ